MICGRQIAQDKPQLVDGLQIADSEWSSFIDGYIWLWLICSPGLRQPHYQVVNYGKVTPINKHVGLMTILWHNKAQNWIDNKHSQIKVKRQRKREDLNKVTWNKEDHGQMTEWDVLKQQPRSFVGFSAVDIYIYLRDKWCDSVTNLSTFSLCLSNVIYVSLSIIFILSSWKYYQLGKTAILFTNPKFL